MVNEMLSQGSMFCGKRVIIILIVFFSTNFLYCYCYEEVNYRLPKSVKPIQYDLHLLTNLDEEYYGFHGQVFIKFFAMERTDTFVLHAANLTIPDFKTTFRHIDLKKCNMNQIKDTREIQITSTTIIPAKQFYKITVAEQLQQGQVYEIGITFSGEFHDNFLRGYYRSSYKDSNTNEEKWLAITQFEPTDARRAFPCFDEPELKAIFRISLARKKEQVTASNMPWRVTTPLEGKEGWVWDIYEDTESMSTYLIAFMVSEFGFAEVPKLKHDGVTYRVWARKDALAYVDFALEVGPKFLEFYESFFCVKYPLPKLDLVAIPDFNSGAMENWGLITFRETEILCKKNSSIEIRKQIATTIAHEIAHMWFGNLVTMSWWNDLWLNEGFATYMEEVAVNHVFPEWNIMSSDTMSNIIQVMELDSFETSHAISYPIRDPREINQVFDVITYEKAALIIRMIHLIFGDTVFKEGLTNYLNEHKFSIADQNKLWLAWSGAAHVHSKLDFGKNIQEIMNTWTLQIGYPIVTVSRNYSTGRVTIEQRRFKSIDDRITGTPEEDKSCWWIPFTYTTKNVHDFQNITVKQWLREKGPVELKNYWNVDINDWIIANIQISGLYRVNYDLPNWEKLAWTMDSSKFKTIGALNRAQIVYDAMAFAREGILGYKWAFKILNYIHREDEYIPWDAALSSLSKVTVLLKWQPCFPLVLRYLKKKVRPLYHKFRDLQATPKTYDQQKLKMLIIGTACRIDVDDCVPNAVKLFNEWRSQGAHDDNIIPEDYRDIVYCAAVKQGGDSVWQFMWEKYKGSNDPIQKIDILRAMGCSEEESTLRRFLMMSINETSGIKRQDSEFVFVSVVRGFKSIGYNTAKSFVYENIQRIYKFYGEQPIDNLGTYVVTLSPFMGYEQDFKELKRFTTQHQDIFAGSTMEVKQSLERVTRNIQWLKKHLKDIVQVLNTTKY